MKKPLLIVISAPSGAGKTTLCDRLLAERPDIMYSISCTTRAPRGQEQDGKDYHFLDQAQFDAHMGEGKFLEHAIVHDHCYGTLSSTVEEALDCGHSILMDIDVQGASQVRQALALLQEGHVLKDVLLDIFVQPPSLDVLKERLVGRGEDTGEVIGRRLDAAADEMACTGDFSYVIVNDNIEKAYRELSVIIDQQSGV